MIELLLFVVGCCTGSAVNWAIYRLAILNPRPISPWSRLGQPGSRFVDFIPVIGWWSQRRFASHWGRGFWIRPLLLELAAGIALPLFWHGLKTGMLTSSDRFDAPLASELQIGVWTGYLFGLLLLLLAATFIDFDEKTIPDEITLPGTLMAWSPAIFFP